MAKKQLTIGGAQVEGSVYTTGNTRQLFATLPETQPVLGRVLFTAVTHPDPAKVGAYLENCVFTPAQVVALRPIVGKTAEKGGWSDEEAAAAKDGYTHVVWVNPTGEGELGEVTVATGSVAIAAVAASESFFGAYSVKLVDGEGNDYGTYTVFDPRYAVDKNGDFTSLVHILAMAAEFQFELTADYTSPGTEAGVAAPEPEPEPEPEPTPPPAKGGKGAAAAPAKGGKGAAQAQAPAVEPTRPMKGGKGAAAPAAGGSSGW